MNLIKEKEYQRYTEVGHDFINYIHPTAIIEKDVVLGIGNNILQNRPYRRENAIVKSRFIRSAEGRKRVWFSDI